MGFHRYRVRSPAKGFRGFNKRNNPTARIAVTLPASDFDRLAEISQLIQKPVAGLIRDAVAAYLRRHARDV